jgi:hypothetical protein
MAKKAPAKTLGDYLGTAVGPVLIMALVGSLVFFLLEVLYVGHYQGRLQWILFFFVFGAVLIARISMQTEIAGRAGLYGLVLGGLVWLALLIYVDYRDSGAYGWAVNAVLIAIIWWCAHRLTWDCTLIDDTVDASGAGLLEVAGLEKAPGTADGGVARPAPSAGQAEPPEKKRKAAEASHPFLAWWDRYRHFQEERGRRPHAPGVWVVYFSLAALPLFGLGQALIPEEAAGRRRYTFLLLVIYVTSGLGLLLTTSFLGLRRYLRQRGMTMPASLAGVWVTVGAALIAGLLLVGVLLPRPDGDTRWLEWAGVKGTERKASPYDLKGDSPGQGEGRRSAKGQKGQKGAKAGDQKGAQAGKEQGGDAKGKAEGGGKDGKSRETKGKGGEGRGDSGGHGRVPEENDPPDDEDEGQRPERGDASETGSNEESQAPANPVAHTATSLIEHVSPVVKWILYIVLGLAAAYVLFRVGWTWLKFLANFTYWAQKLLAALRSMWQELLGWLYGRPEAASAGSNGSVPPVVRRPFAAFRDPFLDGSAEHRSRAELIRYSFDALQAWAWERDLGRQPGETPLEFAHRLGEEYAALDADARRLVSLYARLAYAPGAPAANCLDILRQFWQQLTDVSERPLSAGMAADEGVAV